MLKGGRPWKSRDSERGSSRRPRAAAGPRRASPIRPASLIETARRLNSSSTSPSRRTSGSTFFSATRADNGGEIAVLSSRRLTDAFYVNRESGVMAEKLYRHYLALAADEKRKRSPHGQTRGVRASAGTTFVGLHDDSSRGLPSLEPPDEVGEPKKWTKKGHSPARSSAELPSPPQPRPCAALEEPVDGRKRVAALLEQSNALYHVLLKKANAL